MSDTAAQPPADPFSAPSDIAPPAPTEAAPLTAPVPQNPFEPATPAAVAAAAEPEKPAGPDLSAGTLVAYQWDDPYEGIPKVRAGIVVSAIAGTDDQGPQAVVAWFADDTSILPTSDVTVVDTSAPQSSAPQPSASPPAGS